MKNLGTISFVIATLCVAASVRSQTHEWTRQIGTGERDESRGVTVDALGNVYMAGTTRGTLGGVSAGDSDAFVSKYDANGLLQWTRQFGTMNHELVEGVSADRLGNVYIAGGTHGELGESQFGRVDSFLTKYDADGNFQWSQQLGTRSNDWSEEVSTDGLGNVYIAGLTEGRLGQRRFGSYDSFLSKYDENGTLQWTQQLGTSAWDESQSVSADGLGNVYIAGQTQGNLNGRNAGMIDAFVSKYDDTGTLQWTRQLGTRNEDPAFGVSADRLGNVFISGSTSGQLEGTNEDIADAFISKYDSDGTLHWTRQISTEGSDQSFDVSADGLGNAFITGHTEGDLGGVNAGFSDAFVSKFDSHGSLKWTRQIGSSESDFAYAISAAGSGTVYISGRTRGNLAGTNAGDNDAFLAKFTMLSADFNQDGVLDVNDLNDLTSQSAGQTHSPEYDLTGDQLVNADDIRFWVNEEFGSWIGDSDLNGEFNTGDLVQVFRAGKFESQQQAVWTEGDWNGDGSFTTRDLVFAFQDGGYEQGPRQEMQAVPEPSSSWMLIVPLIAAVAWISRKDSLHKVVRLTHGRHES